MTREGGLKGEGGNVRKEKDKWWRVLRLGTGRNVSAEKQIGVKYIPLLKACWLVAVVSKEKGDRGWRRCVW